MMRETKIEKEESDILLLIDKERFRRKKEKEFIKYGENVRKIKEQDGEKRDKEPETDPDHETVHHLVKIGKT